MENKAINNKRIAKNTLLLYFRMFIIMGVTFYTTRVLLKVLGIDDYGIYNTIAGVVVLFAFLNTAMVTTTQRFINFYLGKNDFATAHSCFSMSLMVHFLIAVFVAVMAEIIGLWFLYNKMSLPPDRFDAAFWTLHFSVAITFVNIIKSPYNACIIAFEKMDFYAYVSIFEAVLKLAVVFLLGIIHFDHLIVYGFLLLAATIIVALIYKYYCNRHYEISIFKTVFDKKLFSDLFQFSLYSLFGNAANIGAQQGVSLLVNVFTCVAVNAAIGVSNQLSHGIYSFISNFQMAFNPVLVKLYAQGNMTELKDMMYKVSRFSFYLMLVICVPVIVYTDDFMHLWLKEVPPYSVDFCRLIVFTLLVDSVAEPLWKAIQASGNIKRYQITVSLMILFNLPVAYLILRLGLSPVYIFLARLIINICALAYRYYYVKQLISLPVVLYFRKVIIPIILIGISVSFVSYSLYHVISNYIISSILMIILSSLLIWSIGMTSEERRFLSQSIIMKIKKQ